MISSRERNRASDLRNLCLLAATLILLPACALGQAESDPWLVVPGGDAGPITARTTREDLVHRYGAANVVDEEVGVGEGDTEMATVLFPKDPERRIEILWQDEQNKRYLGNATISGKASLWHAVHGISLGMSYSELARINGKPFPISWGTDMGSVVPSWNGGLLEKDLRNASIWFDDLPPHTTRKEAFSVGGRLQERRRVNQISWGFPAQSR